MSSFDPVFRPADSADSPYIADLMISSAPAMNSYVFGRHLHPLITEAFRSNRGIWAAKHAYVIAMGKDVVAVATFYPTRDAAKIVWDGIRFIFSDLGFVEGCKILFRTLRTASIYKPFLKNSAYIANVACSPSHQGKGLASLLMKSIEGLRGPLRVERYELDVELDNTPARKLYEKLGWKVRNMTIPSRLLPGVVRMVKEF